MLLNVIDGGGYPQQIIVAGQETVADRSGSILIDQTAQTVATANLTRSGFQIQNTGANPMRVNDLVAAGTTANDFVIGAGQYWPPQGYPVTTGAISLLGTIGDTFVAREW